MPDVVVTRPLAQAIPFAQRVAAIGRTPVVFPLLEILPLPDQVALKNCLAKLDDYALIAFVSPNAIEAALTARPDWPNGIPLAVIGEGSRRKLAEFGITDANATIFMPKDVHRTDSQTLLDALDTSALRGKRVLIIRGETGRELLADELRAAGAIVTQQAAYRRCMPALDEPARLQLADLLAASNDWIVTSSEALRNLARMAGEVCGADAVAKTQQQNFIVPHQRIAETARTLGMRRIVLTGSGDEALLAALQSHA